jgi:hypothetical protein
MPALNLVTALAKPRRISRFALQPVSARACALALAAVAFASAARAADSAGATVFRSGPAQTALVELYSSEGCSSCPPAEAWLNRLGALPGLWSAFVPVALHVNYWDRLGWRDPWASAEFTDRQRAYARAWRSDSVYTPAVVLNGQEWRAWSGRQAIPRATTNPGVLTARSSDGIRWEIEFAPTNTLGPLAASVALLSRGLESDVRAGENQGRRLRHDFVAVALVSVPLVKSGNIFRGEAVLSRERAPHGGSVALAAWVTTAGEIAPLQAVGGDLPAKRR